MWPDEGPQNSTAGRKEGKITSQNFLFDCAAWWGHVLVPQPRIEPTPAAWEAES